jgi:hypothetical protein
MKIRKLFITGALLIISSAAFSQFQLGIKGGLNMAELDIDQLSTATKTGYHFGAFTTFKFGKIALQPEIIFSQQGTNFEFDGADLESNFSYVNIPVILKIYIVGGLNLQAGPQFGYLTSAESTYNPFDPTGDTNVRDYYDNADISLALGIGWDLPFNVNLDFRYNKGMTDINDANLRATRNQVFQVSAGIRIID